MRAADNLELVLRDAPAATIERGRKLVTFARLLATDAQHTAASSVRVNLDRARVELGEHARRRLLGAVLELVRHHLYAALGPQTFVWLGEVESSAQTAWSVIEEHRDESPWLCPVTEPGEAAVQVAGRLLACASRLGLSRWQQRLWAARKARSESDPERGESAFRELLADALRPDGDRATAREALAGLVECALDRGAVRHARTALDDARDLVGAHARLRRLLLWVCVLQADESGVRAADAGLADWSGRLPLPLGELRRERPAWLPYLTGKTPPASTTHASVLRAADAPVPQRRDFGAALLAVFAAEPRGTHSVVHVDVAPGLRGRVTDWLRERDGACLQPSEPEHRMVVSAAPIFVHRHGTAPLRGTLSPTTARALALAPLIDEQGELIGWLRVECEHHLLPTQAAISRAAEAWRARVVAHRHAREQARVHDQASPAGARRPAEALGLAHPAKPGPCTEVFRELVRQLAMKTAQRRWSGFAVRAERAELVAEGGSALAEPAQAPGRARAVLRAVMSAGIVRFDEPSAELALDLAAASGIVLPLVSGRRLCGLLAVESNRRKDFPDALCERWIERCRAFASELRIAQFRTWHLERFGHDVHFRAGDPSLCLDEVFACGRSRAPALIVGPPGCGKQVLARWLHFESDCGLSPLHVFAGGGDETELWGRPRQREGLVERARGGTLLIDDVERLSEASQLRLLEQLDAVGERPDQEAASAAPGAGARALRWIATSRAPLAESVARGQLRQDLCQRLQRLQLEVSPLARRRSEIPAIAAMLARRFAAEEGLSAPSFSDDANALLWRQPWPGNLRQLENFVFKVVLLYPGQEATAADLTQVARRFQLEVVTRLPSRTAEAETVLAALTATVNLRGSINKTRAALYLGWDPDTLASRMADHGLSEASLAAPANQAAEAEAGGAAADA